MKKRLWIIVLLVALAVPLIAWSIFLRAQESEIRSFALQDLPESFKQSELIAMTYNTGFFRDLCGVVIFKLPQGVDGKGAVAQLSNIHPTPVPGEWLQNGLPASFVCGHGIPEDLKNKYLEIMSSPNSLYQHVGNKSLIYTESMRMFAVLIYF